MCQVVDGLIREARRHEDPRAGEGYYRIAMLLASMPQGPERDFIIRAVTTGLEQEDSKESISNHS
jgi:hypothetical protein